MADDRQFTPQELANWVLQGDPDAHEFSPHHPLRSLQARVIEGLRRYAKQEVSVYAANVQRRIDEKLAGYKEITIPS